MTIDEAIEQEKFKARVDRIKANKRIFHNNDEDEISACHRSAEKHEQLAEWLEELKAIKDGSIPIIHGKAELELHDKEIYNKALDDFAKALITMYERYDIDDVFESSDTYSYTSACYIFEHYIDEIAEQLKAGGENES